MNADDNVQEERVFQRKLGLYWMEDEPKIE